MPKLLVKQTLRTRQLQQAICAHSACHGASASRVSNFPITYLRDQAHNTLQSKSPPLLTLWQFYKGTATSL